MLICCAAIAALATAKFETDPRCFVFFYEPRDDHQPVDWSVDMAVFFLTRTSLPVFFVKAILVWALITLGIKVVCKLGFSVAFVAVSVGLSPLLLLIFPAAFWVDIPWTQWSIHNSFHDGRGIYPFSMLTPRIIVVIAALAVVISVAAAIRRRMNW